jgi:enoyl-CoA hydratase/carnithine racemase
MNEEPTVLVEDKGEARWITLNRPRKRNAQSPGLLRELERVLLETRDRRDLRVVVLAGAGPSFSAGHDLNAAVQDEDYARNLGTVEGRMWQEAEVFVRPVTLLRELPMPTVCRVQGHCVAAAMMLVAAADLVVAAEDAQFASRVTRDQGADDVEVPTFAWDLGVRQAKQLLWLSEGLDAEAAQRLGLVNWVVPAADLDAKVEEVVAELVKVPREALALSKLSFDFIERRRGRDEAANYHFLAHQLSHNTEEAKQLLAARVAELEAKLADRG